MKIKGKLYSRFKDETWEKAMERNNGFDCLLEAVQDALKNDDSSYSFLISNDEGTIVFDSSNYEDEQLKCLMLAEKTNRYFVKADYDDYLSSAIADHTKGFASEQDAINDMEKNHEDSRDRIIYYIYLLTDKLEFERVYVGQAGNL